MILKKLSSSMRNIYIYIYIYILCLCDIVDWSLDSGDGERSSNPGSRLFTIG